MRGRVAGAGAALGLAIACLVLWLHPGRAPRPGAPAEPPEAFPGAVEGGAPSNPSPPSGSPKPAAGGARPAASGGALPAASGGAPERPPGGREEPSSRAAPPRVPSDLPPPPRGVHRVARARVEAALEQETALARRFRTSRTVHDGHRLLKLGTVEEGGFLAELGLASRDVLMLVDGEWVTDRDNPLWEALRTRDELVLVVVREGTPHSWLVRIE